jgi:iron complex transport system substrate-binding protein
MRIRFKARFQVSGFRFQRLARWRFAGLALLLVSGLALASDEVRVISMAPHLTELVYAAGAGDRLVGVVDWSDYPPEASELPSIGDAFRFDLEQILGLVPDLALAWRGGTPTTVVDRLEALGIEVLWIETRTLEDIALALETIGRALDSNDRAEAAAADFRARVESFESGEVPTLSVFYQVSRRPLYTLGGRHVINEVFGLCSLRNIFADLDVEAAVVDQEAVLAAVPDLIIAGIDENHQGSDPLAHWRSSGPVLDGTTQLHQVDPTLLIRPTPRIIEGIEHLCELSGAD